MSTNGQNLSKSSSDSVKQDFARGFLKTSTVSSLPLPLTSSKSFSGSRANTLFFTNQHPILSSSPRLAFRAI